MTFTYKNMWLKEQIIAGIDLKATLKEISNLCPVVRGEREKERLKVT